MTWIGVSAGADEVHDVASKHTRTVDIKLDPYPSLAPGPFPAAVFVQVDGRRLPPRGSGAIKSTEMP